MVWQSKKNGDADFCKKMIDLLSIYAKVLADDVLSGFC